MEHHRELNALVLGYTSSVDLDRYLQSVPEEIGTWSFDILSPKGHNLRSNNKKWNIVALPGGWSSFDADSFRQIEKKKEGYGAVVVLCTPDPSISYNKLAAFIVNFKATKIIIIFKNLSSESIELNEHDGDAEFNYHQIMRCLNRELKPANTEIHTSFVAIHPYFGYVCRPNAVIDFGFKVPDVYGHGTSIETDRYGFRNAFMPKNKPVGEYWIGLFGGSSAFSIASSDNKNTIAAYLEKKLQSSFPEKNVRVLNLALPAGKQPQQLNIFLQFSSRLDGIVCFDGANEVLLPTYFQGKIPGHFPFFQFYPTLFGRPSENKQFALAWIRSYFRDQYKKRSKLIQFVAQGIYRYWDALLTKRLNVAALQEKGRFESLYDEGESLKSPEQLAQDSAKFWGEHILMMRDIAVARNMETLFILQPIADIGKRLTEVEKKVVNGGLRPAHDELLHCFRCLQEQQKILFEKGVLCRDFTKIFDGHNEDIYADHIHFEDKGCEIVAGKIAEEIALSWVGISLVNRDGMSEKACVV